MAASAKQQAERIDYMTKKEAGVVREHKGVIVDRELDRIYKQRGDLTTEIVLEEASSERSPLHQYFEWDDSEAARKYRLHQATALLMASKMVVVLNKENNGPPRVVGTVRRLLCPSPGEGFKMRNEALNERDARQAVIERKYSALRSWCRETVDIEELASLRTMILDSLPAS